MHKHGVHVLLGQFITMKITMMGNWLHRRASLSFFSQWTVCKLIFLVLSIWLVWFDCPPPRYDLKLVTLWTRVVTRSCYDLLERQEEWRKHTKEAVTLSLSTFWYHKAFSVLGPKVSLPTFWAQVLRRPYREIKFIVSCLPSLPVIRNERKQNCDIFQCLTVYNF